MMNDASQQALKKYEVDTKYNLRFIGGYLSKQKWKTYLLILLVLILEIITFSDNFVFKFIVDKAMMLSDGLVTQNSFMNFVIIVLGLYILIRGVLGSLIWFGRVFLFNRIEGKLMKDIETDSFRHIMNLSYRYHTNKKTGSLISQMTRGVNKTEALIDTIVFTFIPTTFKIIISIGVIAYFDKVTSLILFLMILTFVISGVYITNKQRKPQSETNYSEDTLKQNISDIFTNIETVKFFAKEKNTSNYFTKLAQKLKENRIKFWDIFGWYIAIQSFIITIGIASIIYFSFSSFAAGTITMGSITLIYASIWKLIPHLFGIMHGYQRFVRHNVDVSSLFKTFKEKNEVVDTSDAKKLVVKKGNIKFENVSFSYPEQDDKTNQKTTNKKLEQKQTAIKNFNLNIKKNTKIALVGPSGGGKSTVVKLLYRLFDLNKGKISIDGKDISQVTQESLRNCMSIVPQEPILFDNTIWFNIAYANPKASKESIWKAIKFAQLDKLITKMPKKEKTIVGERGVKLSGGEKQRVSIARAILANKKILVLDEATSALDSETEKEIQADLEKLMKGRTSIVIAHRLSTIMKADIIVVIKEGKIVETGSHQQLKNKQGGLYKRLWSLQQGGNLRVY